MEGEYKMTSIMLRKSINSFILLEKVRFYLYYRCDTWDMYCSIVVRCCSTKPASVEHLEHTKLLCHRIHNLKMTTFL